MTICPTKMQTDAASNRTTPVIKLERVGKHYPLAKAAGEDNGGFWALKDISLEVTSGKVLGVIGRNGAGKTTLLNAIAGVLSVTEGEVKVAGRVLGLFNLGVGFQDELTGRENVFLNGTILGARKEEIGAQFDAIVAFSELGEFINMPMGTYSQGMRLRLAFSIIAHLDFEVLLMDEVLAVGDALFQSKCYERLMDFKRAGKTLVLTTQSMEMIERLCDEVILLDHGKLKFSGSPTEAVNQYRALLNSEQFYVGPSKETGSLIENTKKWSDDISEWGKKLGTRETIIQSVEFLNRWGWKCQTVSSGQPLRVRVSFDVRNVIKEPHFGIAIFRNDGVYVYGPNTVFDRHVIKRMEPGKGWFELQYRELLLAPGDYKISVAIWDKSETLPFDYHSGYYDLKVTGANPGSRELLRLPCKVNGHLHRFPSGIPWEKELEKSGTGGEAEAKLLSAEWVDAGGASKNILRTGHAATLKVHVSDAVAGTVPTFLWLGLFRDDDVYCQGFVVPQQQKKYREFLFPELPLLPGGYRISAGVWDEKKRQFTSFQKNAVSFRMVFDHEDHGTVYLKHVWKWGIPE